MCKIGIFAYYLKGSIAIRWINYIFSHMWVCLALRGRECVAAWSSDLRQHRRTSSQELKFIALRTTGRSVCVWGVSRGRTAAAVWTICSESVAIVRMRLVEEILAKYGRNEFAAASQPSQRAEEPIWAHVSDPL